MQGPPVHAHIDNFIERDKTRRANHTIYNSYMQSNTLETASVSRCLKFIGQCQATSIRNELTANA